MSPRQDSMVRVLLSLLVLTGLFTTGGSDRFAVSAQAVQTSVAGSGKADLSQKSLVVGDRLPTKYELPFGSNPYSPSEARADFSGFLQPSEIPTAAYCGHCHSEVHAQWRQSGHANSFRAPWYLKNVAELTATRGIASSRHCESCHNPAALFTGALTTNSTVARPHDEDGVTCMACHSIKEVTSTRGIGSYVMGRPAVMVDAAGKPVSGLPSDTEILTHLDRHRAAVMQPLYKRSEFCAACHKAAIPQTVNDYKWLRTFSTYDEWQQSSWSRETPLSFYRKSEAVGCQGCHMRREASRDVAAKAGKAASHRWLGANTAVPAQYGFDEQAREVVEFLKRDQIEIDLFGLTVERGGKQTASLIAPLGSKAFTVLPGDWVRVDVVVRNKGIGHTLIPELRDFYESWVDFEAKDDSGHTIYHSGRLDEEHRVDPKARSYGLRIVSSEGGVIDHHEVWKTRTKVYDATVMPGRSDVVRYRFRVPVEMKGMTLSAAVRYRRFRRVFTDWVFGDKPEAPDRFPTVTMAAGSLHIIAGVNEAKGEVLPPGLTDLLRWNNYGIGMLDRLQFSEAADAFHQVVKLDPKYQPGYVNVAIAEYSRGRYEEALRWLDRGLQMDPEDARAMYYKGLCFRWQTHFDEAIAVMEPVGKQYPRFRQLHQELGYLYMVRRRFTEAKAEYEAVLQIDPDDPIAHRWLGPVLAALGDAKGAAAESKMAAATGNDTSAGWLAQRFWREHLDIASEAMPGHTHSEGNERDDADVQKVLNLQNPPSYIWVEHY